MKKLYILLLLLPAMALGADESIFPEEPSGDFPFIGWIDLPGVEFDPEVQEVLYGAEEQSVVGDEDLVLLSENSDGTDFAFQNWPELPGFASYSEDPEMRRSPKRRKLHDDLSDVDDLPCLDLGNNEEESSDAIHGSTSLNLYDVAEVSDDQADVEMEDYRQDDSVMDDTEHASSSSSVALHISERFKSNGCRKICANKEFQEFYKNVKARKNEKKSRWGNKRICVEWKRATGKELSLEDTEDWVAWAAQHEQDSKLKKLAEECWIRHKAVRMNDVFKTFLIENFFYGWSMNKMLRKWKQHPERKKYKEISADALAKYLSWAKQNESCEEMQQLANKYRPEQPGYHRCSKMKIMPGLKEFCDKNYTQTGLVMTRTTALEKKWHSLHPNKPVSRGVFYNYVKHCDAAAGSAASSSDK